MLLKYAKQKEKQKLREKCPNTEFFLVRIFPYSDWIRKDAPYLSVFSPNARKYGPKKNFVFGHFSDSVELCIGSQSLCFGFTSEYVPQLSALKLYMYILLSRQAVQCKFHPGRAVPSVLAHCKIQNFPAVSPQTKKTGTHKKSPDTTVTCSELTIETLEQGVKYFKSF